MDNGRSGSHWIGCEKTHHDCALAKLYEARRLIGIVLDFWSVYGVDTPDIDVIDSMIKFMGDNGWILNDRG